jgi:hypothetical protein
MTTPKALRRSTKWAAASLACAAAAMALSVFWYLPRASDVIFADDLMLATTTPPAWPAPLDAGEYDRRLLALAHVATSSPWHAAFMMGTTTASTTQPRPLWPVRRIYPHGGALLPFNRIVAYYGNFYSTQMGILGQYDEPVVLEKLKEAVMQWEEADPATPVVPAIEYIDVTAQAAGGPDGKYRARMADSQVDKAIEMANKVDGIVVLDIQVGLSSVQDEVPLLDTYFAMPQVNLALDPEFAMHGRQAPGTVIGTMDAADINWAIEHLSTIVRDNHLPPKILVVHRFTEDMVTNYQRIKPTPEVEVVMQMDGWGGPARKINTYNTVINPEPVQFTGFKLFYKNDLKESPPRLMTPQEVLSLTPAPIFIQYQ